MLFRGEFVKDHAALGLADALDDDLLGGLGGDTAEVLGFDLFVDQIAELHVGIDAPGGLDLDLGGGNVDLVYDFLLGVHLQSILAELDKDVVGVANAVLFVGGKQGLGDAVGHIVHGDAAIPLKLTQRRKDLTVVAHICFLRFCQRSTRRRTSATWDLVNVMDLPA